MSDTTIVDVTGKLVINPKAREWCKMPYPGHPHGCPNYGGRRECPPDAPMVQDRFDLSQPHWFAIIEFDLAEQVRRMGALHPGWSMRKKRNCLYWQNGLNKKLRLMLSEFINFNHLIYTIKPEAMGVNVLQTARNLGIPIKTKPSDTVYKIALVGSPKPVLNLMKEA